MALLLICVTTLTYGELPPPGNRCYCNDARACSREPYPGAVATQVAYSAAARSVSLVWDTDQSAAVQTPSGIIRGTSGPRGFNGRAVNIYGNNGAFPHIDADGSAHNGGVPQAGNLSLHLLALAHDIEALIPNASFTGYCLIDYEQWRASWNATGDAYRALSIAIAGGPSHTSEAQAQYEAAARTWFLATIATVRSARPGCSVGWYGYPTNALPHAITPAWTSYCAAHPDRCWFDHGGRSDRNGYLGSGGDAQRAINDNLCWLFAALDVITPSVYLGVQSNATNGNTTAYVSSTVQEAVRLAAAASRTDDGAGAGSVARRRVVPLAWHHYDDYWRIPPPTPRAALTVSDLTTELRTPLESGADGLLIWGAVAVGANASDPESAAALQLYADGPLASVVGTICGGETFECAGAAARPTAARRIQSANACHQCCEAMLGGSIRVSF